MTRKPRVKIPPTETHITGAPPEGLRDQLALRALEIIIGADARAFLHQCTLSTEAAQASMRNVAQLAYGVADAMLEARGG